MDINRDIKQHFSRFQKYIIPNGITYYDKKDYDNHEKKKYNDDKKKYKTISDDEASKK
jgi:NAD+--asparagine ADP-ribosyltransferase